MPDTPTPLILHHRILGEGTPLVILHGMLGMLDNWNTVARILANDHTVVLFDLRNHGRSPRAETMCYGDMAADVVVSMENLGFESGYIVLGHSMGGKVAMELALRQSHRISGLVAVDISPLEYVGDHLPILDAMASTPIVGSKSREAIRQTLIEKLTNERVVDLLLKNLARTPGGEFEWRVYHQALTREYRRLMKALTPGHYDGPTMIVRGSKSGYLELRMIPQIREYFPQLQLETLDAGHWVHAEQPQALVQLIRPFADDRNREV